MVDNFKSIVLTESFANFLKNSELALEVLRAYALLDNKKEKHYDSPTNSILG
jgi:hypothetical protein